MENYLSLIMLIFAPLVAFGVILSPVFGDNEVFVRRFSKGFAALMFIYSLLFFAFFDTTSCATAYNTELKIFDVSWLKTLGITASFGVDSLSLALVILTTFIFLVAFIASKSAIRTKHKFYYSMLFLLESAVLGLFCSKDMFLFFLFWELELIPMYFLISEWGTGDAKKSAMKYVLYTFWGSMFMLLGMLVLYFYSFAATNVLTANIESLSLTNGIYPSAFQSMVFAAFAIGFAVKIPIIPFHTWLPSAHCDSTTPVSIVLAAVLLKMGIYGFIRFNMSLFPEIFKLFAPALAVLALINILFASFVAIKQVDLKKIVAYSSISHMGIIILGLSSLNEIGIDGATFQMIAHGLIVTGLFFIVGVVYNRCKIRNVDSLGGLASVMPNFLMVSYPIMLAAAGVPLLMGFPGEFLSITGLYLADYSDSSLTKVFALLAILGLLLSLIYIIKFAHSIFYGQLPEQYCNVKDIRGHQLFLLFVIAVAVILFGIFPNVILDIFSSLNTVFIDMLKV